MVSIEDSFIRSLPWIPSPLVYYKTFFNYLEITMQTQVKRNLVKTLIVANHDKFLGVTFTKKNGEKRRLNGRLHVHSKTGQAPTTAHIPEYLTIYDVKARGFRIVNLNTVESIRMKGGEFKVR